MKTKNKKEKKKEIKNKKKKKQPKFPTTWQIGNYQEFVVVTDENGRVWHINLSSGTATPVKFV